MKIQGHSLYQEMQSMMLESRAVSTDLALPKQPAINTSQSDFSAMLKGALDNVNALQGESRNLSTAVEMGDPRVSLAQAMIAGQKASLAFDATVQVRTKLVEAYKEIMSMPV
ncbi:flagellar hook-basal body complex protein FliE [Rheinheimera sp.]|uniref:flagellar hook-basal body complex protein FliE n=1 Tax=Rheinheimera sp. TaxID=1869214 RepID=UPI00307F388D